jgi:hypothetical protein
LVLSSLGLLGCVNTDPAVFVDPTMSSPSLTVGTVSVLEMGITAASFSLDLHLGARAAGPATVKLVGFSVLDSTMANELVPTLEVEAASGYEDGVATVEQNSDLVTSFALPPMTPEMLTSAQIMTLCAAGEVVISGTFSDSLKGTNTTVYSPAFTPSGCAGK